MDARQPARVRRQAAQARRQGRAAAGRGRQGQAGGSHQGRCAAARKAQGLLGDRVEDVRVSARLTDSPSCLAMSEWEMAPHMAHLLREAGQDVPENKPTLEINTAHPLLKQVAAETDDARATDLATLLLEQAELSAGAPLPAPAAFVPRSEEHTLNSSP